MPIFEYHCNDCETEFEVLERARDANKLPKCPNCKHYYTRTTRCEISGIC